MPSQRKMKDSDAARHSSEPKQSAGSDLRKTQIARAGPERSVHGRLLYRVIVALVALAMSVLLVPMWLWTQCERAARKLRSFWH